MPGIVWQANVLDLQGNVIPAANVEVREQISGVLVPLFADFDLLVPLPNPTQTDGFGYVRFFVANQNLYRIVASKAGFTRTWEYVLLLNNGTFVATDVSTPAALAAGNNNNFDAGIASALVGRVRFQGNAGGSVLTGMIGGTDGRRIIGHNISANAFNVLAESGLSLAANRFAMNGDLFWPAGASYEFIYDGLLSRWSRLGN